MIRGDAGALDTIKVLAPKILPHFELGWLASLLAYTLFFIRIIL